MRRVFTSMTVGIVATLAGAGFASGGDRISRLPWKGHAQSSSEIVVPGSDRYPARCGGRPAAVATGEGLTTLLGPFVVEQSHCLGVDGTFDLGEFVFTTNAGRTIEGTYFGQLLPTNPPVSAVISGNVCVQGGSAFSNIADDCAAGLYSPVSGVLNLETGQGSLVIDYPLGLRR